MRILLVEDDEVLVRVVCQSLRVAGHRVDVAQTLSAAELIWSLQPLDAVLLDLNLPLSNAPGHGMGSGLQLLKDQRARGDQTPVMVLTARNRTDERIAGLNAGADDYIGKPFDLAELEARLRAMVRRSQKTDDLVRVGRLTLDRKARAFAIDDRPVEMPPREFEVLWELMTPPGAVLSKKTMSEKLSELGGLLGDNALEAFVYRLRKKLVDSGASIRTIRGLGYTLDAEVSPPVSDG